jgi:diamine N-acetyltransferase
MIETERLDLKLLEQSDEQDVVIWRNQKDIIDSFFSYKGITLEEHREWYSKYLKSDNRIEFVILLREKNKKIGTIGLSNIDYRNQKAEYGILLGEKGDRGKGYAEEASRAIIKYAFNELNMHKISLKVFIDNSGAIKLYLKLGFKEDGVLRQEVFKNGMFKDVLIMSILREEFEL